MLLLIIFYLLIFTVISWRRPIHGLFWILATLPIYMVRFQIGPMPTTLLELQILIFILVAIIQRWRMSGFKSLFKFNSIIEKFLWPILIILFAASWSLFYDDKVLAPAGIWKAYFVEPIILFLVSSWIVKDLKDRWTIISGLLLGGAVVAIFAIYQKFTGFAVPLEFWQNAYGDPQRVTSFFGYPNAVGLYLGPLVIMALVLIYYFKDNWKKVLDLSIFVLIGLLAIVFARSFGALIGIVGAGILLMIFNKKLRWFGIGLAVICLLSIIFVPAIKNKVFFQDTSGQIRQYVYSETWQMLKDHPIAGGGLARYQQSILPYHKVGYLIDGKWQPMETFLYPHNIILNFWSELGILGLVGFLSSFAVMIWIIKQKGLDPDQKLFNNLVIASFLVIMIHGLVDVPYFKNDLSVVWWSLLLLL